MLFRLMMSSWIELSGALPANEYRRDVVGTFRVYAVSIPYADLIGEGEEAYTENPYTEYEEYEEWNALKGD